MTMSQRMLVCVAAVILGGKKYSVSSFNNCGDECPETCLCPCRQTTGECTEGCVAGYYGYNCNKTCDSHCMQNVCLQESGHCECLLGYMYTNSRCVKDTGKQCRKHQGCHKDICSSTGEEECIEGCKPGLFGTSCESPCGGNCFCDQVSGKCTDCVTGWFGPECQSQCSSGCTEGCYKNGSCIDGCKSGSYGEQCDRHCSRHCVSGCDQLSGECVQCEVGRYGQTCQSECSAGCAGCDREGSCMEGCVKGYYGEMCVSACPQGCNDGLCDLSGSCMIGCVKGYYGEMCKSTCQEQCDDRLCDLNGRCKSCKTGFYGPGCSKICEGCAEGHCDRDTGECYNEDIKETFGINYSWVAGGVSLFIIGAVFIVYVSYRLKRMDGRIYYSAKWRRHPSAVGDDLRVVSGPHVVRDPSDVDEELGNTSPRVCHIRRHEPATYIEPIDSDINPVLPQQQAVSDSDQQVAAASSKNLQPSDGLLNQAAALTYTDNASSRPNSYYQINEDLIFTPHQLQRKQQIESIQPSSPPLSDRLSAQSDDRNATGGVINIPLIAECSWNTETEDSSPDKDSRPDDENYDHPFKDNYN